ncbi:MAG: alpha/beta fold hydrolase [Myxococcota bacterium]
MKPWARTTLSLAGVGLAAYTGYGGVLWWYQDSLIFPVPGGIDRQSLDFGAHEVGAQTLDLEAADGTALYGWHYRGRGERLVIYLPGNGESVAGNIPLHRLLQNHNWDVVTLAYRGYPGSEGAPSEEGLVMDATALWEWASREYPPSSIVLHGRSLGGGVATHLAEHANPSALVLESSFRSMRAVAGRWAPIHPVDWLLRHPFDTETRAPVVGVPTLIVHSSTDRLIPPAVSAYEIRDAFAESESLLVAGWSHAECLPVVDDQVQRLYLEFLDRAVPLDD